MHTWSVILSGGEGERVRPLVESWLGRHKPKQYCAFLGSRSMFQHTIDRADRLVRPENRVIVIAREHSVEACRQLAQRLSGRVIEQPANRNTAAGVFLPLTFIRAQDPGATVVVFPSDHFACPEEAFINAARRAVAAADQFKNKLILVGVPPEGLELEYGWVCPGAQIGTVDGSPVRSADSFIEKPPIEFARSAIASGALWNTFVFAARAEFLWQLGWKYLPEVMRLFQRLADSIGTRDQQQVLQEVYRFMPALNFSSDLLSKAVQEVAVIEMADVLWSDWGKPERIIQSISQIGKEPAFPLEALAFATTSTPVVEDNRRETWKLRALGQARPVCCNSGINREL